MKIDKKTVGLITLVIILLGSTVLIATRLLSENAQDSSIVPARTKATFQKQVEIASPISPSPTKAILALNQTAPSATPPSPTETILTMQGTTATQSPTIDTTITATAEANPTTTAEIPNAGSTNYSLFIFLAATMIVFISLLY